jgi:aspartate/glutamate racemase/prolyl-tRNA editing enzyme YbaK/EbsC (Cys-tRNA(Pro) deacylase)
MNPSHTSAGAQSSVPAGVQKSLDFFQRQEVWRIVSRNSPATSCRDASARRNRLGSQGIPLHDELKSLCVVKYRDGNRSFALLHCRAHRRFDLERAAKVLQSDRPLVRLSTTEMLAHFGMDYGTVNPFVAPSEFEQVFDEDVLGIYPLPGTMMTNLGHHEWAVEFEPQETVEHLGHEWPIIVARITGSELRQTQLPSYGIITGNGPESGMALWRTLNHAVREGVADNQRIHGDFLFPRVITLSLPEMGLSMELRNRYEQVRRVVDDAANQLCSAGIGTVSLACNTTQHFCSEIRRVVEPKGVEFLSMAESVLEYIRQHQIDDVTIIGIPVVADLGELSAYKPLRSLNVRPVHPRAEEHLQELGYLVKKLGHREQDSAAMNKLQHIIKSGVETEHVLIALTEISVLLQGFPKHQKQIGGKSIIDPLRLHGESMARKYLRALPVIDDNDDGL